VFEFPLFSQFDFKKVNMLMHQLVPNSSSIFKRPKIKSKVWYLLENLKFQDLWMQQNVDKIHDCTD
jgi:hypothetical protein